MRVEEADDVEPLIVAGQRLVQSVRVLVEHMDLHRLAKAPANMQAWSQGIAWPTLMDTTPLGPGRDSLRRLGAGCNARLLADAAALSSLHGGVRHVYKKTCQTR